MLRLKEIDKVIKPTQFVTLRLFLALRVIYPFKIMYYRNPWEANMFLDLGGVPNQDLLPGLFFISIEKKH